MSGIFLTEREESELFVLLKPHESTLPEALRDLLHRVERSLYSRLTIEDIERLSSRFSA
jgi:hypothetical protein